MARARCLISIDGALVVVSAETGRRYQFTRQTRELAIDDWDIAQFDAKTIATSRCGCRGGQGTRDAVVRVFEIVSE